MNYQEALSYLQNLTKFGFNFGLDRITELMKRLGNPQESLKIVHVGGTNGKGSTCAIIESVLRANGYKVGVFSSPHLHSYTERYRVNGICISEEDLAQLIVEVKPHLEAMVADGFEHPTEFEVCTAIAFCYFARVDLDILLLEVGLGGSIDSTNIVNPILSIITNVSIDHMDYLGTTVKEIAQVKSGIIKPKVPIITGTTGDAAQVIEQVALSKKASLYRLNFEFEGCLRSSSIKGINFDFDMDGLLLKNLDLNLVGKHQVANGSIALAAVKILMDNGLELTEDQIRLGLKQIYWPGRFEVMQKAPMVVLDGAHNYEGIVSLKNTLKDVEYKDLILVMGMLGDKEREKVIKELAPLAKSIIITKPNNPRAGDWEKLADEALKFCERVTVIEDIQEAVKQGVQLANNDDLVCVTGSLYMIATAREVWSDKF